MLLVVTCYHVTCILSSLRATGVFISSPSNMWQIILNCMFLAVTCYHVTYILPSLRATGVFISSPSNMWQIILNCMLLAVTCYHVTCILSSLRVTGVFISSPSNMRQIAAAVKCNPWFDFSSDEAIIQTKLSSNGHIYLLIHFLLCLIFFSSLLFIHLVIFACNCCFQIALAWLLFS